jgi:hypothetical protein
MLKIIGYVLGACLFVMACTNSGTKPADNTADTAVVAASPKDTIRAVTTAEFQDSILKDMADKGQVLIAGCMYNLQNGSVEFYP